MLPAWATNPATDYLSSISRFGAPNVGASNPVGAQAGQPMQLNTGPNGVNGVAGSAVPGMGGFGFNLPTANFALGGIQTVGNLWNAYESRKLARDEFDYKKGVTDTNLNNQIKSYNTALEDRSRSRAYSEGQDASTAQSYIDKNRLSR